jgi:hypothetical protein
LTVHLVENVNLQPPENAMDVLIWSDVLKSFFWVDFGTAKPSKEKKKVAYSDTLVLEVGLVLFRLAENLTPTVLSREPPLVQVGIRVGFILMVFILKGQASTLELSYDAPKRLLPEE